MTLTETLSIAEIRDLLDRRGQLLLAIAGSGVAEERTALDALIADLAGKLADAYAQACRDRDAARAECDQYRRDFVAATDHAVEIACEVEALKKQR